MDSQAQSSSKILFELDNTYVSLNSRSKGTDKVPGKLRILQRNEGLYIAWRQNEQSYHLRSNGNVLEDNLFYIEGDNPGRTNGSGNNVAQMGNSDSYQKEESRANLEVESVEIDFPLANLRSFKYMERNIYHQPTILFVLTSSTIHPIYFFNNGAEKLIETLRDLVTIQQSQCSRQIFLVSSKNQLNASAEQDINSEEPDLRFDVGGINFMQKNYGFPEWLFSGLHEISLIMQYFNSCHDGTEIDCGDFLDKKYAGNSLTRSAEVDQVTWRNALDDQGRVKDVEQVKILISNGGISHGMRSEIWKFLLEYYPWNSTQEERENLRSKRIEEYFIMKRQWKTMTPGQISRYSDFRRKQAYIGDSNTNLQLLKDILTTYLMYNFDLGYVQGMSDLLSPILYTMNDEADAFWCFVGFMEKVGGNFEIDGQRIKSQLNQLSQILEIVDIELYMYLGAHEYDNMYFAFRWLIIIFKREFKFADILRLWEVYWTGKPCENFHLVIAVSLLQKQREEIIKSEFGLSEVLKHIYNLSGCIDLDELLNSSALLAKRLISSQGLPEYIHKIIGKPYQIEVDDKT